MEEFALKELYFPWSIETDGEIVLYYSGVGWDIKWEKVLAYVN